MSTMDDRYRGPATLHAIDLTVDLVTTDDGLTYSWDGRGTTNDLRALNASSGKLILPSGQEGVVHVAHTRNHRQRAWRAVTPSWRRPRAVLTPDFAARPAARIA
jgi:hypothetical protein